MQDRMLQMLATFHIDLIDLVVGSFMVAFIARFFLFSRKSGWGGVSN